MVDREARRVSFLGGKKELSITVFRAQGAFTSLQHGCTLTHLDAGLHQTGSWFGTMSPFVTVSLLPQSRGSAATLPSSQGGTDPHWTETHKNNLVLEVSPIDETVLLQIWNWNTISDDELVGSARIPVNAFGNCITLDVDTGNAVQLFYFAVRLILWMQAAPCNAHC